MSLILNTRNKALRNWLIGLSVIQLLFMLWLPDSGYDKYFWQSWTQQILVDGLGGIYTNPEVNNHPLNLFLLKVVLKKCPAIIPVIVPAIT